ncbi:hypothetical protein [Paractinoplanes toevensis]|uniref:Uncharacterized protein n=1 Tax=Paractinoplanes toevensis TaxID=571911 RepID=A0A919TBM7_9ACTN|nr:hypothetical protein [Actinoplanes toevensis]GIM92443.1 hypothetical protein Ato02nite_042360 [Actinoplanes toevensis]
MVCPAQGCGHLTGPARQDPADGRWQASLDLTIAAPTGRVSRQAIRADAALAGLEVLRQPQAANPSFLTAAQFTVVRRYLSGDAATLHIRQSSC